MAGETDQQHRETVRATHTVIARLAEALCGGRSELRRLAVIAAKSGKPLHVRRVRAAVRALPDAERAAVAEMRRTWRETGDAERSIAAAAASIASEGPR